MKTWVLCACTYMRVHCVCTYMRIGIVSVELFMWANINALVIRMWYAFQACKPAPSAVVAIIVCCEGEVIFHVCSAGYDRSCSYDDLSKDL